MIDVVRLGFSDPNLESAHEHWNLPAGPVEYMAAWDVQKKIHAEVVAGERPPTLILLEHQSVYTAGKRTLPHERPFDGTPVVDVDRGGKITWHGPHQLVGYPIVPLPTPINVVGFVRQIETAIIDVVATYGIAAVPVEGRSGVWIKKPEDIDKKIAAIGLRVARRATMHGFALNCANSSSWADRIIPCGISDAGVTSISEQCGKEIDVPDVIDRVESRMLQLIEECCDPARLH